MALVHDAIPVLYAIVTVRRGKAHMLYQTTSHLHVGILQWYPIPTMVIWGKLPHAPSHRMSAHAKDAENERYLVMVDSILQRRGGSPVSCTIVIRPFSLVTLGTDNTSAV